MALNERLSGDPARAAWIEGEPRADPNAVRASVHAGARLSVGYLVMNAAATLIAGFGLLADSQAVVIGAMLIAMLYGPILGLGFALAELDAALLRRAGLAEIVGVAWVTTIGVVIGWISLDVPIGEQILARTTPNLLDLLIALVGGGAGAYAALSPRISGAVVGVAIATSLCPPLTACGILLAHGLPGLALGAFELFLANFAAILVAAMVVFLLLGYRAVGGGWIARALPVLALVALAVHLVIVFRAVVDDHSLRGIVARALDELVPGIPGARVVEVRLDRAAAQPIAYAVIRAPSRLTPADVARLDDAVDRAARRDVALHVRTVLVEELTREGMLEAPAPSAARARTGR